MRDALERVRLERRIAFLVALAYLAVFALIRFGSAFLAKVTA